jgi:cell division septal protein FtsQ
LRRLDFFRVRQVELVGIRYLDADQVLRALGLAQHASVFDATDALAKRVRALDGVADASVSRRLPGSLKVIVREIDPVALVANPRGALAVVDAAGRPLPFDPATQASGGGGLDLPIVQVADSGVIAVLARIQALEPALFQTIDGARGGRESQEDIILELGSSRRVLLARDAGSEVIQAVTLVAKDLALRSTPYLELDARYAGQIIVRRRRDRASAD